jgi:pantetheine-phosphate adenylyltransferase
MKKNIQLKQIGTIIGTNMKTLAIYAGSFRPFHIGHLNIVDKMEKIFGYGNIMIAIGVNPSKVTTPMDQSELLDRALKLSKGLDVPVEVYTTFLHELIEKKELEGYNVILVRGLRNGDDLDYEDNQLKFIKDFKKDVNVVFIRCDEEFEHISSSAIRALESFRPGSGEKYLVKI